MAIAAVAMLTSLTGTAAAEPYFPPAEDRVDSLGVWPWQMADIADDGPGAVGQTPGSLVPPPLEIVGDPIQTPPAPSLGPPVRSLFDGPFEAALPYDPKLPVDPALPIDSALPVDPALPVALQGDDREIDDQSEIDRLRRLEREMAGESDDASTDAAEAADAGEDVADGDAFEAGESKKKYELWPKSIALITPFARYDPDPNGEDPCRYLCPRPGGCPPVEQDEDAEADQYQCPEEIPLPQSGLAYRTWETKRYHWVASDLTYNPLYFEDAQLERYGQTYSPLVQPFASTGKFLVQTVALPYQMAIDSPHACVSPLGYYRPGECVPKLHSAIPWDGQSAFEAALMYGATILVLP